MISKRIISMLLAFLLLVVCIPFSTLPANAATTLMWPVPNHTALSRGWIAGSHYGLDIHDSSINGATIVAAMGGRVTHKWTCGTQHYGSYGDCNGFGTGIVIRGNDGRDYNYGHMQAGSIPSNVYVGATVNMGDVIGRVGTTGNSTGPHLHFGISNGGNYWTGYVNPSLENYVYEMGPPTSATISITKNAYTTQEPVIFNMSGNGNTNTLWVYRIDGQWENHYSNAGNSFELTFGWEGQYKALMETWNGQGSKISNTVYFKIGGPSYATIKASKDTYTTDETATFTLDADGATNTVWFYYPDGTHEYIQGCTTTCTKKFTKTGKIEALVQSWNDAGNFISERISFTVTAPSKPSSATVKTSKSTYAIDEDVIFTITGNGSTNDLYMARIDGQWSQTRTDVGNSFSLAFGWAGTYEAYVITKNSAGSYQSAKIQYVIGTPTPTSAAPTTAKPTTAAPTTAKPTTAAPTTVKPTTTAPTTAKPTTAVPTTVKPTTAAPTTAMPTTAAPTTAKPTTAAPTTAKPTTTAPTTAKPTTAAPTTVKPTTTAPTTAKPTTAVPTTVKPTTAAPTTAKPTTAAPTTAKPTTAAPTTAKPTTAAPATVKPTAAKPATAKPTSAVAKPNSAAVVTNKEVYLVGEATTFICSSNGDSNALWIYFPDGRREVIDNVDSIHTMNFSEPGLYIAQLQTKNSAGTFESQTVTFTVTDEASTQPTTPPETQPTTPPTTESEELPSWLTRPSSATQATQPGNSGSGSGSTGSFWLWFLLALILIVFFIIIVIILKVRRKNGENG